MTIVRYTLFPYYVAAINAGVVSLLLMILSSACQLLLVA